MEVRRAVSGDVAALCGLYQAFYAYNAGQQPEYYRAAEENGAYPAEVLRSDGEVIFVAEEQGTLVGLIHAAEEETPPYPSVVPHRFAQVVDLYVLPDCRGKGVGRRLMEAADSWGKERGLDYMELFVLENNEVGIGFYEREGFETVSRTMRRPI